VAATCPIGFDVLRLRNAVAETYDRVARDPQTSFRFNMGADYAVNLLRYERSEVDALPKRATAASPASGILIASEQFGKVRPLSMSGAPPQRNLFFGSLTALDACASRAHTPTFQ
jgi:hypothetical protein